MSENLERGVDALGSVIGKMLVTNKDEGDYVGEDGLLYCGKCHTRRQFKIEILGEMRKAPIMCKCREEAKKKEDEAIRKREVQERIQRLKLEGITDTEYLKWTLDNDDRKRPEISEAVKRYCDNWETMRKDNVGILFYGDVGTGKTFFAACIANELINRGTPVLMTNITLLISAMSKNYEEKKTEILRRISNIPLLILDDVGVERDTTFGYEKVQEIIDTRYRSGKPLIVTTNLSPSELKEPKDMRYKRVYDRILEMCHPIKVNGDSRRQEKAAEKRKNTKNILGI